MRLVSSAPTPPNTLFVWKTVKAFKSLKRHLRTHIITAKQYRAKWNLPPDYPMVAPNYAMARAQIAKQWDWA